MRYSAKLFSIVSVLLASTSFAQAAIITGPADPNYTQAFQGASAATFAGLGFTIGTGASDLKVHTEKFVNPSGFGYGTMVPGAEHINVSGTTYNKMCVTCYVTYGASPRGPVGAPPIARPGAMAVHFVGGCAAKYAGTAASPVSQPSEARNWSVAVSVSRA